MSEERASYNLDEAAKTLTIEWDNRGSWSSLLIFLVIAWFGSIAFLGVAIWVLVAKVFTGPAAVMYFVIFMASLGVIFIPLRLLSRFSREKVEFTATEYRSQLISYPWLFPTKWPIDAVSRISIGHHVGASNEPETMVTLNAWRGWRRSLIAYWLHDDEKIRIHEAIEEFFKLIDHQPEFEENFAEGYWEDRA